MNYVTMNRIGILLIACMLYGNFVLAGEFCKYRNGAKSKAATIVSSQQNTLQNAYDAQFQHLNLHVERTNKNISGSVRTIAKILAPQLDTFAFELHSNLVIDSVVSYGTPLYVKSIAHERRAILPQTMYENELVDITIYYHGTPPSSGGNLGDGFSNAASPSWGNKVTWSLSEPYAAYEWFPCKQALQDKLDSVWIFVTTDSSNQVAANGLLSNVVALPNGKKRYEWKSAFPIDYYLISIAVGQYVTYRQYAKPKGYSDSILIQNYIYNNPQTLPYFKEFLDSTAAMIKLFSELYGLYPFAKEKYGHAMAPISGGMEHQTMSTMGFFTHGIVAHELGHQWFGDNVTCSSWSDIFINEGFAAYSEYLATEFLFSKTDAQANMVDVHNNVMSEPDGAIWFTDTSDSRIFDARLTYDKGAAVIHSIRYVVNNDSLFFAALKNFQTQYRFSNGSIIDFKTVLEATTALDFTQFFNQWIYGEGYPLFSVQWNSNDSLLQLKNTQTTSAAQTPLFFTPIDYLVKRIGLSDTLLRLEMNQNIQSYTVKIRGRATSISIDPKNWILNTVNTIVKDTSLSFGNTTNIHEPTIQTVAVYPNPASTRLFIETTAENFYVEIMNTAGKIIAKQSAKKGEGINITALPPLLYIGRVTTQNQAVQFFKFVKQ